MEDFILRVQSKKRLDYECCIFVDSDFKFEDQSKYDVIEVDNAKNIVEILKSANKKSVIDCMFQLDLTKLILIDMGATTDKGFWTWLDECLCGSKELKAIPIIVKILEEETIPEKFAKKCLILIHKEEQLPNMAKLKLNINMHSYKKYLLNMNYVKAYVKSHEKIEEIMFNQKRKYL